jgi:hypothetical protein
MGNFNPCSKCGSDDQRVTTEDCTLQIKCPECNNLLVGLPHTRSVPALLWLITEWDRNNPLKKEQE